MKTTPEPWKMHVAMADAKSFSPRMQPVYIEEDQALQYELNGLIKELDLEQEKIITLSEM